MRTPIGCRLLCAEGAEARRRRNKELFTYQSLKLFVAGLSLSLSSGPAVEHTICH